jgi:hypothetical protein
MTYDHEDRMVKAFEMMAVAAMGASTALQKMAQTMDPPMEAPPDTSWVETEDVKRDYRPGG